MNNHRFTRNLIRAVCMSLITVTASSQAQFVGQDIISTDQFDLFTLPLDMPEPTIKAPQFQI